MNKDLELDTTELKKSINNLLWTYLPSDTTIEEAERIANELFQSVQNHWMRLIGKHTGNS